MDREQMRVQCVAMSDLELIRAVTVNRSTHTDEFRIVAEEQLRFRGIDLARARRTLIFDFKHDEGRDDEIQVELDLDEALARLDRRLDDWDMMFFRSAIGETAAVQQDGAMHEVHLFDEHDYVASFTARSIEQVREVLAALCRIESWEPLIEETRYDLAEWSVLGSRRQRDDVGAMARALAEAGIPFVLRGRNLARFHPSYDVQDQAWDDTLLVPPARGDEIEAAFASYGERLDALGQRAEELAASGQTDAELDTRAEIVRLAPEDADAAYDLACLLMRLGRSEEAIPHLLHGTGAEEAAKAQDALRRLVDLGNQFPDHVVLLHNLAGMFFGVDAARAQRYYERILEVDPDDAIAHVNLANLHVDAERDDQARRHYTRYLELTPDAEDREAIEAFLAALHE
jgi:tetratricopeptide (TPR) repeat protein